MAEAWYDILQHEFAADEGSFLLQLRVRLVWDKAAFTRLTAAMLECCKEYDTSHQSLETRIAAYHQQSVPRWLAEGFWFAYEFTWEHTSHPAWRENIALDQDYYEKAYERLFDLADWFFTGHSPLDPDKGFSPM